MNGGYVLVVCIKEYNVLESYINCRSIHPTYLRRRAFFLSNGVHYVCVSCVRAGQWAGKRAYVSMVARLCGNCENDIVKLAGTTKKQDGQT